MSTEIRGLEDVANYYANLKKAKASSVVVGLPISKATSKVYSDGQTVLDIGISHEYGKNKIPQRSFLRTPFIVKKADMSRIILREFKNVADKGEGAMRALKIIGIEAENIVKDAFTTKGFGNWQDIKQSTKDAKGSSQVLIDTGTLRSSIISEVRAK